MQLKLSWALVAASVTLVGCGGGDDHDHEHEESHVHEHHAPHGGTLAMLGDHSFQLELVGDANGEFLNLYVLDGEAERFIRVATSSIQATAVVGEERWELAFQAQANAATGETVGDSSHFRAATSQLLSYERFELRVERMELRGQIFDTVVIPYPDGKH